MAIAVFRVFQETLTNISKHANASSVQVKLVELEGLILLEVIDNGCGITDIDMEKQASFGIRGMRERCQQLKGNFHISGDSERGTKVTILIPMGDLEYQSGYVVGLKSELREPQQSEPMKKKIRFLGAE